MSNVVKLILICQVKDDFIPQLIPIMWIYSVVILVYILIIIVFIYYYNYEYGLRYLDGGAHNSINNIIILW